MERINRKFILFAVIFIFLILIPVSVNKYYNYQLEAVSKDNTNQIFVIRPGEPTAQIAQKLKKANLVKSALAFRLLVSQMGIAKNIQAGDFRLSPNMSSREIAQLLTHGAIDVWVTLPEGLRVEEQAQIIENNLNFGANESFVFDKTEYIKIAKEGYMFPDTYLIPKDATAQDVAAKLEETFDAKVADELLAQGEENNVSSEDVIILASLLEREARTDEEKPIIAGILLNRLEAGMPLQVDATVQYAKGYGTAQNTWWPTVTVADYQSVKSAYNTYLFVGLPPSPIANPGLASIKAAANPAQTSSFYYMHDREGKIHYAETADEHQRNIDEYL
ncbi:MAG TPA: endolytic transglycosylase MltG [Patescibacteria group bacterium]|nr:endolytic transglycosylase MltG [Patescibacteria group bacterium]